VVDLGSGKGYLSQYLSLRHGVSVVGIDSQDTNTKNAEKRNAKTLKIWHFLLRKANSQKGSGKALDEASCLGQDQNSCSFCNRQNITPVLNSCEHEPTTCESSVSETKTQNPLSTNETKTNGISTPAAVSTENHNDLKSSLSKKSSCHKQKTLLQNTGEKLENNDNNYYDNQLNSKLSATNHFQDDLERDETDDKFRTYASYQPVTKFVSTEVKIVEQIGTLLSEEGSDGLVLVGLHTCGDLAPTAIKIFLNDCHVKALCLVGCCYHLLSQVSLEEISSTEKQTCEGKKIL